MKRKLQPELDYTEEEKIFHAVMHSVTPLEPKHFECFVDGLHELTGITKDLCSDVEGYLVPYFACKTKSQRVGQTLQLTTLKQDIDAVINEDNIEYFVRTVEFVNKGHSSLSRLDPNTNYLFSQDPMLTFLQEAIEKEAKQIIQYIHEKTSLPILNKRTEHIIIHQSPEFIIWMVTTFPKIFDDEVTREHMISLSFMDDNVVTYKTFSFLWPECATNTEYLLLSCITNCKHNILDLVMPLYSPEVIKRTFCETFTGQPEQAQWFILDHPLIGEEEIAVILSIAIKRRCFYSITVLAENATLKPTKQQYVDALESCPSAAMYLPDPCNKENLLLAVEQRKYGAVQEIVREITLDEETKREAIRIAIKVHHMGIIKLIDPTYFSCNLDAATLYLRSLKDHPTHIPDNYVADFIEKSFIGFKLDNSELEDIVDAQTE
jgi:hypothetical protein